MAEYLRKECGDLNEAASDNDDVKDDDDANSKDVEVVEISAGETLAKLDRLTTWNTYQRKKGTPLSQFKLEKIRMLNKKQSHVSYYFMLE